MGVTLSTNVQGLTHAGEVTNIVIRGAFIIPGGTAEIVAQAVERKLLARGRKLLQLWQKTFASMFPNLPWTGPSPNELGLHRLAGGLIMSDTCNTARATKRLLASLAEAAAREKYSDADWAGMDHAEQEAACTVYTGDCAQHVRNIILNAMSTAGAAYLKIELEDSLSEFMGFERMSTEMSVLIRAVYKELHHEGDYAKGKGKREFQPWLREHHPHSAYFVL
eukprot:3735795-Pleurochrysis_carterae.AAC.2